MLSKLYSWALYRLFIYLSRHVDFKTFSAIWNEAYAAHVEAEWNRLKRNSLSIKYMQGGLEVSPVQKPSAPQYGPIC